ncbi:MULTISPECIES: hypothetical protein [unclassified Streptomyces]|nr:MULTISPECIES: hypothetical protein [unclassified Streptomyces]WSP53057.1 hypothetical protein OG306_00295 [Streptomyces sp. NBC_01241]MCX4791786.1 hypothetical protein [Streptomyces sp. NBC_01221]MCX4799385.1 hypothetical protein [Streptomyces sp. NBC_01242]WSJ40745.1 hypothetical protein OG772_35670 [Streptomyces sp. NBC_01321]WSP59794.1 hypothetical protein OG306_39850 [Streptomyces sp. NBC_01241]
MARAGCGTFLWSNTNPHDTFRLVTGKRLDGVGPAAVPRPRTPAGADD